MVGANCSNDFSFGSPPHTHTHTHTHMVRHTEMCCPNGLVTKDFFDLVKNQEEGPISPNCEKMVKSGVFEAEKPLEIGPNLQKNLKKNLSNQPFFE